MKLEIVEYHGGDYHIVDLADTPGLPHIGDPWFDDTFKDVDVWCEQTFGSQDIWGSEIISGWKRMRNRYYFAGEDKLNWFVTRWA